MATVVEMYSTIAHAHVPFSQHNTLNQNGYGWRFMKLGEKLSVLAANN